MQDKWKDLIPFYVAGTLPDNQKQALEAYLAQCGDPCFDEVEEWRTIASATWQNANDRVGDLPPLSQAIRTEVAKDAELRASGKVISSNGFNTDTPNNVTNAPVAQPRVTEIPNKRRGSRIPLTMVAAFMTVVIFGGILISQLAPEDLEPEAIQLTEVADVELLITDEFGDETGLLPDNDNDTDSGILATPTPLNIPQPTVTPFPPPTSTPLPTLPPNSGGGLDQSTMSEAMLNPGQGCMIRNETAGALSVYENASFEADTVGIMREGQEAQIRVQFGGWYELSYGRWVYSENVIVYGNCSNLITATPTAIGDGNNTSGGANNGIPQCVVSNNSSETVNLYQWPNYDSPVNGRFSAGQSEDVVIGDNGWYQVFYAQWVNGNEVSVSGSGCNNLWIPTPTIAASPTIINPTFASGSSSNPTALVVTTNTVMRGAPNVTSPVVTSFAQGTTFNVLAHNGVSGPQRWYLVRDLSGVTGWIPMLDVQVNPNDLEVRVAATIPVLPSATPQGFVPTPGTPQIENWSHVSTVVEQGCGGESGVQNTIATQIQRYDGYIQVRYPSTGTSFTLSAVSPERYIGSYQTSGTIEVDLTFTSDTGYIASETVTAQSGCIVRSTWTGTRQ